MIDVRGWVVMFDVVCCWITSYSVQRPDQLHRARLRRSLAVLWHHPSSAFTLFTPTMKLSLGLVSSLLLSGASIASAAAWSFQDATVAIASKGAGVGGAAKNK